MKAKHLERPERRRFLQTMVAAGSATTLLAVGGTSEAQAAPSVGAEQADAPAAGYRRTPHIDRYYRTLRS
jgi:hypothetical protein